MHGSQSTQTTGRRDFLPVLHSLVQVKKGPTIDQDELVMQSKIHLYIDNLVLDGWLKKTDWQRRLQECTMELCPYVHHTITRQFIVRCMKLFMHKNTFKTCH